jgi:chromate transporter
VHAATVTRHSVRVDGVEGETSRGPVVPLSTVLREWGRIGCVGFGGPPTHIRLLRDLCVDRKGWIGAHEFEDAITACNLLPGPASTQLAIFCAWRIRARSGAILGGLAFTAPGLLLILGLSAVFLATTPPAWIEAAGAGAGAAVAAVAVHAGAGLTPASWQRATLASRATQARWLLFLTAGALAAATKGAYVVLAILGCGAIEVASHVYPQRGQRRSAHGAPLLAVGLAGAAGVWWSLGWVALKVGALSYGGGFVIIPLMQADAVNHYHWMTAPQFLNAVALGQVTPGPVVLTVAVVGYAAAGVAGALFATAVAFSPSFAFVLLGANRFDQLRGNPTVRGFLNGAGPAAIGAILGSAVPLARAIGQPWQVAILVGSAVLMFPLRRSAVTTLLSAGLVGVLLVAVGAPLPH